MPESLNNALGHEVDKGVAQSQADMDPIAAQKKTAQKKPGSPAEQHWIFLDVCKVVAVLFIVVMHVSSGAWGQAQLGSFDWHVLNVFNGLSRIGMPLFFMQIGAALLNESNDIPIRLLYKKYILRIVTAFLFWSAFYMLIYYWLDAPNGFASFEPMEFIGNLLGGAPYSQWFILLAISMFLVIPILRAVARDMSICKYFLALWAFFSILLPAVYKIPAIFPGIPQPVQDAINMLANSLSRVRPNLVLEYPGYMLLGFYIHNKEFSKSDTIKLSLLGLAGLLYTVLMTVYFSLTSGAPTESFFGSFSINICLMAASVMVAIKYALRDRWINKVMYKGIRFFSNMSFGIFLIHDFLRMGLVRMGIDAFFFTPILSVPVLSIAVFALSGAIAFWLRNLPKVGPYIIGD